MGCWAIGSFGNDDAADWLSGLTEQDDLALVRETISQLLAADGYLDAPYATDALVVSLGVDTFEDDPISSFALGTSHFVQMGTRIAALRRPTVLVQEGGYAVEAIGANVAAVLAAFAGRP